jgi:DDE superfamily endonuclease
MFRAWYFCCYTERKTDGSSNSDGGVGTFLRGDPAQECQIILGGPRLRQKTLELLAGELARLTTRQSVSRETVRRRLAENDLKPWRKDMWCIPQVDAEYVARMEDVLDLYAESPDPNRPVACFDESPTQLIGEVRTPIPAKPGQLERYDCEYRRNGTANLFVFVDVHRPWGKVKVTESRTAVDFAAYMRELADIHFPKAERIRVVLDNLSIQSPGARACLAQSPPKARQGLGEPQSKGASVPAPRLNSAHA